MTDRVRALMRSIVVFAFSCSLLLFAQSNTGELRIKVADPSGLAVRTTIQIVSQANQYQRVLSTDDQGALILQRLPYGVYQVEINQPGFARLSQSVDIHSAIPTNYVIRLKVTAAVNPSP